MTGFPSVIPTRPSGSPTRPSVIPTLPSVIPSASEGPGRGALGVTPAHRCRR
jgi:hypothetical protein